MKAKKTIIRIKRSELDKEWWTISKHGSKKLLTYTSLYEAIHTVSSLIKDRKAVIGLNIEVIRE